MLLRGPTPEDIDPRTDEDRELYALMGQVGRTITQLRPAGMTDFDGHRVDTLAEGMVIEAGTLVRVIDVRGHRVVVRQLEEDERR
jgi:membrane-bound serine protease (ClpP class)